MASIHSNLYRNYVLLLMTVVYTFNFLDRQIIAILSPAIQEDLKLSDWQLGVLKGFAFSLLYTVLGIPIARLADRYHRVAIVSVSLGLWSAFTALSGAASNFLQLALARIGVGIGEAGGSPPIHSLISDYFKEDERGRALAIYSLGVPIGVALAYLGGGWVAQNFSWRTTLYALGLPGIGLAFLFFYTVQEPIRGAMDNFTKNIDRGLGIQPSDDVADGKSHRIGGLLATNWRKVISDEAAVVWRSTKLLWSITTYRRAALAMSAASFSAYAIGNWIVDFYVRTHPDVSILSILFWLGLINGTAYLIGTYMGGYLCDRFAVKNRKLYGFIPGACVLVFLPSMLVAIWHPSPLISIVALAPAQVAMGMYLAPTFAIAQALAPVAIRALSAAVLFMIVNFIAAGFGPTIVGVASSVLTPVYDSAYALKLSMSLVSFSVVVSSALYFLSGRSAETDWYIAGKIND